MSNRSLFDFVQVVTGLAVVVGLVLVILQLQQTNEIANKQQMNVVRAGYDTVTMSEIGEILPDSLARACEDPENLTGSDLIALNAYYLSHLMYVLYAHGEEGSEISSPIPWEGYAEGSFGAIFFTTPGQAWWKGQLESDWAHARIPKEVIDLGNEYLESATTECFLDDWRTKISEVEK